MAFLQQESAPFTPCSSEQVCLGFFNFSFLLVLGFMWLHGEVLREAGRPGLILVGLFSELAH